MFISSGRIVRHSHKEMGANQKGPDKSLASYRDYLGGKDTGTAICSGRGSFDRGDLKEVALSAGAMEFERISLCNE